jgi:rhomboid family GlyGly-CTERM serine protease
MRNPAKLPWLTLLLAGSMAVLFAALGPAPSAWVYDRVALGDGELWRLLSAHLVHSDAGHLLWNMAGLAILGAIVESRLGRGWLLAGLLAGCLAVDLTLWSALPGMSRYCGLSGALNALLVPTLVGLRHQTGPGLSWLIGGGSLLKILIELAAGQALFTHTAWASVPLAHLAGWILGAALVAVRAITLRRRSGPGAVSHAVTP